LENLELFILHFGYFAVFTFLALGIFGLPITVAGVFVATSYFIIPYMPVQFYIILLLVMGLAMISSFRIAKM